MHFVHITKHRIEGSFWLVKTKSSIRGREIVVMTMRRLFESWKNEYYTKLVAFATEVSCCTFQELAGHVALSRVVQTVGAQVH